MEEIASAEWEHGDLKPVLLTVRSLDHADLNDRFSPAFDLPGVILRDRIIY